MPTTALAVIEAARDRHPSFDARAHPDRVLLRQLSTEQRRLVGKLLRANPYALSTSVSVPLAGYDFAAGYAMPDYVRIHTATGEGEWPIKLHEVSWANRLDVSRAGHTYALNNGRLYLNGAADDWTSVTSVTVSYTPAPADLAALESLLSVPTSASAYLSAFLAEAMGTRTMPRDDAPPVPLALLREERARSEMDFLEEIRSTYRAKVFRMHAAW